MNPSKRKSLTQTIANIISTVVLIFSVLICVLVIISMKSSTGVASLFGYAVMSVQSDSMEPTFYQHDLIIVKMRKNAQRYEKGDVVSFHAYNKDGTRFINTHRIVQAYVGDSRDRYVTKGDNASQEDAKTLYSNNVIGQYTGKRVPKVGSVVDFINSPTGVLLCVVIPSAIIIIAQVISYANASAQRKKQLMAEAEERARQERIQLVNEVMAAQRGTVGGAPIVGTDEAVPAGYSPPAGTPPLATGEGGADAIRQQVIEEYLRKKAQEEAIKQAIIEEYLAKQRAAAQAANQEAEADRVKAIIAEYLAQQQSGNAPADPNASASDDQNKN